MTLLEKLNGDYLRAHVTKEEAFWAQKMGLSAYVPGSFETAEIALRDFTSDATWLPRLRAELGQTNLSADDRIGLEGWIRFFEANVVEQSEARRLQNDLIVREGELERSRAEMKLGYLDPSTGEHKDADYLQLLLIVRTAKDEAVRRAAHAGAKVIEHHVLEHGFLELVRERNRLGRMLGYEDYYDFKVSRNEGFGKKRLFELLDELEKDTREAARRAILELQKEKGPTANEPYNFGFFGQGTLTAELDPYFGFKTALGRWGRSFQNLGVRYNDCELTLDLISRPGKYENGFMHGPFPGYVDHGKYRPAKVNFTSLGTPGQIGSGHVALHTLFHEGGHAAHFANIFMPAPCFSQEFAPTSVAYAETQSMFLDAMVGDADWRARYAKDARGNAMPAELLRRGATLKQRFFANQIRQLLVVPYVERAIYEMSEASLTPENVLRTVREIESSLLFLKESTRPTLSIPHLISGDSSAYYHGYVLAEMAVHQTRAFFMKRDHHILDNPRVGPSLAEHYWKSGNARPFLDLVQDLTGEPFSAKALVAEANRSVADAMHEVDAALALEKKLPAPAERIELGARIAIIHGDELVCSNHHGEPFQTLEDKFGCWLDARLRASGATETS